MSYMVNLLQFLTNRTLVERRPNAWRRRRLTDNETWQLLAAQYQVEHGQNRPGHPGRDTG